MKKCTVIGGGGFIGSSLVKYLEGRSYIVTILNRNDPISQELNMGNVFYCAGLTADFLKRPIETIDAHVTLLNHILAKCKFDSLTYLSSTRVYTNSLDTDENAMLLINPNDRSYLYNISKLAGESICLHSGRLNTRVVRLSNVVGLDPLSNNFFSEIVKEAIAGKIVLRSSINSSKDYILLSDVLKLLELIAFNGKYSLYNVASGVNLTHGDWCEVLVNITGCDLELNNSSIEYKFREILIDRIHKEFHFTPLPVLDSVPLLVQSFINTLDIK